MFCLVSLIFFSNDENPVINVHEIMGMCGLVLDGWSADKYSNLVWNYLTLLLSFEIIW